MKKILIINTGGTFNKVYNPLTGNLDIDKEGKAIKEIQQEWMYSCKILNIIGKDSLELDNKDRELIYTEIEKNKYNKIIIIHGTDTIDQTAEYLKKIKNRVIILTGAMQPYSINQVEATANLASSYGFLQAIEKEGIYISMNGIIKEYWNIQKNREKGYFEIKDCKR